MRRLLGFTLIELLVAIVILGILIAVAQPSFSTLIAEQRLRQVSQQLRTSITLARSEAVKRNEGVVLLRRDGAWANGWCIEPSTVAGSAVTACSATPIDTYVAAQGATISGVGGISQVSFNAWGRTASCPKFELETQSSVGACKVCLYIETDGRVSSATGACSSVTCPGSEEDNPWSGACSS
jgi:type IV fimbrial biogenesis protein FimT